MAYRQYLAGVRNSAAIVKILSLLGSKKENHVAGRVEEKTPHRLRAVERKTEQMSEFILYQTEDGKAEVRLRAEDGSVWLSQSEIADLFATTKQNVSLHAANVLKEGELIEGSVVKESLTTATDGKNYRTKLYRLEMILAVGYRVKGTRGTQFRQWATAHLAEYLVKGFVMDDERLKNPKGWDYFDELLAHSRVGKTLLQNFLFVGFDVANCDIKLKLA